MPSKKTTQAKSGAPAVLVIEAVKFQRRSLCRLVRAAGADHVAEAVDAADADRVLARGRHPDWIVVADPDLMGEDAYATLRDLADRHPVSGTLLLSHRKGAAEELRERAQLVGLKLVNVMRKPVSAEEIGMLLRQLAIASNDALIRVPALTKEELSECLRAGTMRATFQPRIDLETGRPVCCEALPCITHPAHGVVPAQRFAQALLQLGAQRVMTAGVLRDAAEFVRQLRGRDLDTPVAVGLLPDVLSESSDAASLDAYVRTLGIAASDLTLEIGAGPDAASQLALADNLARLKLRGYRLALKEDAPAAVLADPMYAHFDEVKLQPALRMVAGAANDAADRMALVLAAARKLGMRVCAVGIPAGSNLDSLRLAGFACAQGDAVAGSMSMQEALAWIEREEAVRSFATGSAANRPPADIVRQGA